MTIDLDARQAELRALRARIVAAAAGIVADDENTGEINSAAGDQHPADHASGMIDRELDESLEENAERVVDEIDEALRRIEAGTYGTCAVCGAEISEERLQVVPYATLCVEDKRRLERG